MSHTLHPSARLLRGFAVDFLTSHDVGAVDWVMDPGYTLSIGGFTLRGRDAEYLPATAAQLEQFPGLTVTAHDVILGPDAAALCFTEHGASVRDGGRVAAWRGITLFRIRDGRLAQGWAEEDYFARKRQLKSGTPDQVAAPHVAAWDQPCLPPDPATEAAVRTWLETPANLVDATLIDPVMVDGPAFGDLVAAESVCVSALFTAGPRAALRAEIHGRYLGGFDDIDRAMTGEPVVLRVAAMATTDGAGIARMQVSADRLGLHRHLLASLRPRQP